MRHLGWRLLVIAWLSFLATLTGVGFRGLVNPSITAFMQQRQLYLRAHGHPRARIEYQWVDYRDIAPAMRLAVVSSEDQTFPYNDGFDWLAIEEALRHNRVSRYIRGASTITQQTAKNLYLWAGRSYFRKLLEAYFTVLMNLEWPKQRILEMYLNTAQFDNNVFGVGAAARHLFNKSPARLSADEAALLAAALPAPDRADMDDPSDYLLRRQGWILDQMQQLGSAYLEGIEAGPPHNHKP
ncbi:MAG: monofunctional biosynthetic peptidoglycan transglycosylase [Gammaproteobacteria bacterium]|nr:monofunctional biosynthetic peptidoglycan transglycosylase [Gammaproteobacteria bacterium]MDE2345167.1 monofunctional biosynthetic peptidoglycan transglycosylase [Gammaproteobacteria bacterium]